MPFQINWARNLDSQRINLGNNQRILILSIAKGTRIGLLERIHNSKVLVQLKIWIPIIRRDLVKLNKILESN